MLNMASEPVRKSERMHRFYSINDSRNQTYDASLKSDRFCKSGFEAKKFQFRDFCAPDISKTNKVRNLKQTTKVAHIIQMP